jgi:serine protease Do
MLDPIRAKGKVIAFTALSFAAGLFLASGLELTAGPGTSSVLRTSDAPVAEASALSQAFIRTSEIASPAVVNITIESTRRSQTAAQQIPPELREFFPFPLPEGGEGQDVPVQGMGTGFLITPDGYILTNNHVVADANRIWVTLQDRRRLEARVVGRDPTTDIAVVKVEGTGFPVVRLGTSENARVGEWVLAIGFPLGLDKTVTAGIVSAVGRPLNIIATPEQPWGIEDFIQTDAAINRGNSGGPLVNLTGDVIGVNTAIASQTGFSAGYGFAVPIDLARRVADDLIRHGRVRRPALGVRIENVGPEDVDVFGLPRVAGVLVQDFTEGSPAERAGIQPGDVIVRVEGREVERTNQLQRAIAARQPGETVTIDVIRYGQARQVRVQLIEAPGVAPPPTAAASPERTGSGRLGIRVEELTQQRARQFGFRDAGGVVVVEVGQYGAAGGRVGRGSRIRTVDRQQVTDVASFQRLLAARRPGEVISLGLETPDGARRIVNLRLPD